MQVGNYLEKHQPVIYKTFVNALTQKTLSHAYLLVGETGTPLLETARHLAKTILCDDPSPLACDTCINCMRFDNDNYPDVIILDGSKGTIKKEQVVNIETRFDRSALDEKGIMIYIIHLVENMTEDAVNSMLKFLEEPEAEVYAFLTTNNENNVLPTIISRCQTLHLKSKKRQDVINEALSFEISSEDAEILSYFYNDGEQINDVFNLKVNKETKEEYIDMKELVLGYLSSLEAPKKQESIFYIESKVIPTIKSKEELRFFIDLLIEFFEDILNKISSRDITLVSYDTIITNLANKLPHLGSTLVELLKERNGIAPATSVPLELDHIANLIVKE